MVKFKIFKIHTYTKLGFYDDEIEKSLIVANVDWEECDEKTFKEIKEGVELINNNRKYRPDNAYFAIVEMVQDQDATVSLLKDEFLKETKRLKAQELKWKQEAEARKLAAEEKKIEKKRKQLEKLKAELGENG